MYLIFFSTIIHWFPPACHPSGSPQGACRDGSICTVNWNITTVDGCEILHHQKDGLSTCWNRWNPINKGRNHENHELVQDFATIQGLLGYHFWYIFTGLVDHPWWLLASRMWMSLLDPILLQSGAPATGGRIGRADRGDEVSKTLRVKG